eukprot:2158966-Amphidinium_carterae.1
MPLCVRKNSVSHTMTNRAIQEAHNADSERTSIYEKPPPSGSRVGGGGHYVDKKDEYAYKGNQLMPQKRKRTMWAMLFDKID